ncbi:MAG: ribbon-helix-helix protein, CopG family [Elusimicrobia bacterium]|nr:ribbon-helix-helix protein, CopG family [Elusimicrobiota bacterium]MDE2510471.1 ribbon-helix-helix protein, CopG family [Elusimicrobiota bacterium]
MQTRVLTAHVPAELAKKVDLAASRLERSRGWIVQKALLDWLSHEEIRRQLTLEGLADVDAGRVVDHESVRSWAESLGTPKRKPVR